MSYCFSIHAYLFIPAYNIIFKFLANIYIFTYFILLYTCITTLLKYCVFMHPPKCKMYFHSMNWTIKLLYYYYIILYRPLAISTLTYELTKTLISYFKPLKGTVTIVKAFFIPSRLFDAYSYNNVTIPFYNIALFK